MARSAHFTTVTTAVTANLLGGGSASTFYGIYASNSLSTAVYYVKLFWEGTGTAPPKTLGQAQAATTIPTAGTSIPHLTIPVNVESATVPGGIVEVANVPLNMGGRIWYWVSAAPGDTDTTALATGGDVVTLIYD
jgi:hypothetical protein